MDNGHLETKLDRLSAQQEDATARLEDIQSALGSILAGLHVMTEIQQAHSEMLTRLNEAVSKEESGGEEIVKLLQKLNQMVDTLTASVQVMPGLVVDAVQLAQDGRKFYADTSEDAGRA